MRLSSALLMLIASSAFAGTAGKTTPVKVCVPQFREEFMTLAVIEAADKGFFKEQGLDAQIIPVAKQKKNTKISSVAGEVPRRVLMDRGTTDGVAGGEDCQFGASVIETMMFGSRREQVRPLLVSMYGQDYDTHLVVAKNSPIKSVKDLKGKRIRLGQLPTHIALNNMLKESGLKMSDVQIEWKMEAPTVLAALEAGEVDAAVTYVPTMPYMLASGRVRTLKSNIVNGYVQASVPHSLVIANAEFAKRSPEIVARFMKALENATAYIARNPSEVVFALKRNASKIGLKDWNPDPVIAERAAAFVGKLSAVDMIHDSPARAAAVKAILSYNDLVNKMEYTTEKADLAAWLSEASSAQKVGSL